MGLVATPTTTVCQQGCIERDVPLFKTKEAPWSRQILVKMAKDTLTEAGIDYTRYNGHSFRIGAATTIRAKDNRPMGKQAHRQIRILRDQLTIFQCKCLLV